MMLQQLLPTILSIYVCISRAQLFPVYYRINGQTKVIEVDTSANVGTLQSAIQQQEHTRVKLTLFQTELSDPNESLANVGIGPETVVDANPWILKMQFRHVNLLNSNGYDTSVAPIMVTIPYTTRDDQDITPQINNEFPEHHIWHLRDGEESFTVERGIYCLQNAEIALVPMRHDNEIIDLPAEGFVQYSYGYDKSS
eukprot:98975_1